MSHQPWKGKLDDGTEVLVSLWCNNEKSPDGHLVSVSPTADYVEVAFRTQRHHVWSPPIQLERAP